MNLIKGAFILTTFVTSSVMGQELITPENKLKETSVKASLHLGARVVESDINKARSVGPSIIAKVRHELNDSLVVNLETGFVVEAGSTQNAFDNNAYAPRKDFILKEASLSYLPTNWFTLSIGAINQKSLENRLFVGETAFVAATQLLEFGNENFRYGFNLTQAIPNNRDLSTRLGNVDEGTPQFFHEQAFFEYKDSAKLFKIHVAHFAYDKLSNNVAYESLFLGNSVSGIGQENAKFNQSFIGWSSGLNIASLISKNIELEIKANFHQNSEVKENNKGHYLAFGPSFLTSAGIYSFSGFIYENQANSTVAYYSSSSFGHTNRKGFGGHFSYQNFSNSLGVEARYTHADTIIRTPYQKKSQIISLELRRDYEFF